VYKDLSVKYDIRSKLVPGEEVFGELYGDGIQKNYKYGCKQGEHKLVVFDVMKDGRWLNHDELVTWCAIADLPMVPILYRGPYYQETLDKMTVGPSVLCPAQKVREGAVVRPAVDRVGACGRVVLKNINPAYLLDKDNSDFH